MEVTIRVNGSDTTHDIEDHALLAYYLRDACGLTGTNIGCDTTSSGACTVLLDGESVKLLTEIQIPRQGSAGWGFEKFNHRAIDWALVGAAVAGNSVALVNMGPTPLRASAVEQALASGAAPAEAAEQAAEGTSPGGEPGATAGYRHHLARVLVRRALENASS